MICNLEKSIAFEIPLDDLRTTRLSLPKLHTSDLKLADTEARWKVNQDLDNLLYGVSVTYSILKRTSILIL